MWHWARTRWAGQRLAVGICQSMLLTPELGCKLVNSETARVKLGSDMAAAAAALVLASSGGRRQFERSDPFLVLTDEQFRQHFRLSKTSVRWICDELADHPRLRRLRGGPQSLTVAEQVLCALRFYATGSFQGNIGSESYIGRHQTTVSRCIKDVSIALVDTAVRKRWVAFPRTASERAYIKDRFLRRGSITGVIGCVDGTYIGIKAPSKSNRTVLKANYFTRKAHYALNTMVVCDADLRILHIDARFPGSCHDAHVWGKSALRRHFELGHLLDDGDCLLGDSGYPLEPWLLTPVAGHPPAQSPEALYNKAHSSMRSVVERCIGVLKARFRCLQKYRSLHHEPGRACHIIAACAALHNISLAAGEPEPSDNSDDSCGSDDNDDTDDDDDVPPALPNPPLPNTPVTASARRQLFAKGKALRDSKLRLFQQTRPARLMYLNRVRRRLRRRRLH